MTRTMVVSTPNRVQNFVYVPAAAFTVKSRRFAATRSSRVNGTTIGMMRRAEGTPPSFIPSDSATASKPLTEARTTTRCAMASSADPP